MTTTMVALYVAGGVVAGWLAVRGGASRGSVALTCVAWPIWLPFLVLPEQSPSRESTAVLSFDASRALSALTSCRSAVAGTAYDALFDRHAHAELTKRIHALAERRARVGEAAAAVRESNALGPFGGGRSPAVDRLASLLAEHDARLSELVERAEALHAELLCARFGHASEAADLLSDLSARAQGLSDVWSATSP